MRRKLLLLIAFGLVIVHVAQAQQDPVFSQYMFNMLGINPAYAGSRDVLSVTALYRKQWIQIDGAPTTQQVSADFALKNKKVGLGVQMYNDKIGITQNSGFYADYAYHIKFRKGTLSMGIQAGVIRFKADYAAIQLSGDQADQAFAMRQNQFRPNFGAGLFYSTDKFYFGFSAPHFLGQGQVMTISGSKMYEQNNHWFITTGYVVPLSMNLKLKPSVLARVVSGAPVHFDFNANLWLHDVVAIGVSYRTSEAVVGMLEIQISQQLRFGYAYDFTFSELNNRNSHELMLRYEFGSQKKKMVSPRYF